MKQHLSNTILAVVLFATAVPLLVLVLTKSIPPLETEPEEKAPAAQKFIPARKKAAKPDDTKEIAVKLSAKLNGRGVFVFEGDTIRYRHESEVDLPREVTVDRRKWDDLSQPFKLGYTPDFANAVIRSKKGPNTTKMTVGENRIELVIDDSVYTWPEYDFVIAMKNQVEPAPKSNRTASTRRDPVTFPTNDFVTPPVVGEFPMGGFPFGPMAAPGRQSAETRPTETVTITLDGTIKGGGFLFEDDSIRFVNRWGYPTGLTVNGVPWTDPKEPFKLDFTPDYASATLLEKDGPGDIGVKTGDNRFSVSIKPKLPEKATSPFATNEEEEPVIPEGPFRLKLAVKKPVPWDVEADEITLTIKGRIYGGKFVFRGSTIVFDSNPRVEPLWPKDITVDGRPWKDLSKPFELDFTPDFAKTVIVEREIAKQRQFRLYSAFPEREFALYVEDAQPRGSIDPELRNVSVELYPFQVKLAVKNQLPHLEVLWKYVWQPQTGKETSQPVQAPKTAAPDVEKPGGNLRFPPPPGSYIFLEKRPEDIWEENRKERKIVLWGIFCGSGTFVFEGNTIRYRHEGRDYPKRVKINEAIWGVPTQPVELPFKIPTDGFELKQTAGDRPVKVTKIGEGCFEVYFKDPEAPSGSPESNYSITITPSANAHEEGR